MLVVLLVGSALFTRVQKPPGGAPVVRVNMNYEMSRAAGCGQHAGTNKIYAEGMDAAKVVLDARNPREGLAIEQAFDDEISDGGLLLGDVHSPQYLAAMQARTAFALNEKGKGKQHGPTVVSQLDGKESALNEFLSYGWNRNTEGVSRRGAASMVTLAREARAHGAETAPYFGLNLFRCPSHHARTHWSRVNLANLAAGPAPHACPEDRLQTRAPTDEGEGPFGFCHLLSIGTAIAHLQDDARLAGRGRERYVVFDSDCHTSNGYEDLAYHNPDILVINTVMEHTWPYQGEAWPDRIHGRPDKAGAFGTVLSVPYREGATDADHKYIFDTFVLPTIQEFGPSVIFHALGFDIIEGDPYCPEAKASTQVYAYMYAQFKRLNIPVVTNLEGGYNPGTVGEGLKLVLDSIDGAAAPEIPPPGAEAKAQLDETIALVRRTRAAAVRGEASAGVEAMALEPAGPVRVVHEVRESSPSARKRTRRDGDNEKEQTGRPQRARQPPARYGTATDTTEPSAKRRK